MTYAKQKIEENYEMHDKPELIGQSNVTIHEYQLGFPDEEGSRKNGLERLLSMLNLSLA